MTSPFAIFRRLTVQLAAALIVASVAPVAGVAVVVSELIQRSLEREAQATQETLLGASRSLVENHIDSAKSRLTAISKIIVSEDFAVPREDVKEEARNREDLAKRLDAILEPNETFLELTYVSYRNPSNKVANENDQYWRANAQQREYGQNLRNQVPGGNGNDYSQNVQQSEVGIASFNLHDPLVDRPKSGLPFVSSRIQMAGPVPFLQMSVPVVSPFLIDKGKRYPPGHSEMYPPPVGVLIASVSLEPIRGMLTSAGAGKATIDLTDAEGTQIQGEGPAAGPDALLNGSRTSLGWSLHIRQPPGEAFATLRTARRQAWMWFGAATVVALLIAVLFAGRILPPVRALTGAAERMAKGDLKARTNVKRGDELGRLAKAFDDMAASLEKLDQLKSGFVSHVSHELRTPLTSMKLSVANFQDGILGPVSGKQEEVLGRVRGDLDRLIHMVNELLDEARLEAGRMKIAPVACDLAEVAYNAAEIVRPIAEKRGVRLHLDAKPTPVVADRAKLVDIVLNVIDNAVKFSTHPGVVSVEVAPWKGGGEVVVADNGPGIPQDKLERIFERFAMVPEDGRPKPPGAGLGLSIARQLVELHGGTITASNALPGPGAVFRIRLPKVG